MLVLTLVLTLVVVLLVVARGPRVWDEIRTLAFVMAVVLALVAWLLWITIVEVLRASVWWRKIQNRAVPTPGATGHVSQDVARVTSSHGKRVGT
jgi:hypothetical protein